MNYPTLNETERLSFLYNLHLDDSPNDAFFNRIVDAARQIFSVPYALINIIGRNKVCIKAGSANEIEVAREDAFCNYTILHDTVMVVADAHDSPSFSNNPFVQGEPHVRFYAGAPLIVAPGIRIGALCIIDTKPRPFDQRQTEVLAGLARLVVGEFWLRQTLRSNGADMPFGIAQAADQINLRMPTSPSGAQLRAARALLDWSIAMLAVKSDVSVNTIKRFEARNDLTEVRSDSLDTLQSTLENHGIVFASGNGVALKPDVS